MVITGTKRELSIDFIKTIAIFSVVFIHTCTGGYTYDIGSFNWTSSLFWGCLSRAGVPLFLMCSGALLLDPEKELTLRKLFTKNILRILVAMLIWALAYKLINLYLFGTLTIQSVIQGLKEILIFKHESHLYYLHMMLLVYLVLPVTRLYVQYASKKQLEYALAIWFIFGILYPTLKIFWPLTLIKGIPMQWEMNMAYSAIGYGILGYYLKEYPLRKLRHCIFLALCGFILIFGSTLCFSLINNTFYQHFLEGMTVGVAVMAAGIFSMCIMSAGKIPEQLKPYITRFSKASFCIYLVHIFILRILVSSGITVQILPCLVSIPIIALLCILISVFIYFILSKIPVLNKWII